MLWCLLRSQNTFFTSVVSILSFQPDIFWKVEGDESIFMSLWVVIKETRQNFWKNHIDSLPNKTEPNPGRFEFHGLKTQNFSFFSNHWSKFYELFFKFFILFQRFFEFWCIFCIFINIFKFKTILFVKNFVWKKGFR